MVLEKILPPQRRGRPVCLPWSGTYAGLGQTRRSAPTLWGQLIIKDHKAELQTQCESIGGSLMKTTLRCLALSLLAAPSLFSSSPVAASEIKNKEEAVASIEKRKAEMIKLSDQIWAFAETAFREHKSSKALSDYAEQ